MCRIVKVAAVNRYDEQCLLIYLDVSEGEFQNYFGWIYARRLGHGDDNYPCVYNQSMSPFTTKKFQRLMASITASNVDYASSCREGEDWDEHELENLLVGVVFREKEFINARGKKRVILIPHEIKSVDEIRRGEFEIPSRLYE